MAGDTISREEIDRLVRELGRKAREPVVRVEPPSAPVRASPEFNMEEIRANRLEQIRDDYDSALEQAEDARESLRRLPPYHPQQPVLERQLREAEARAERLAPDIGAVVERERARKGNVPPWVRQEMERVLNPRGPLAQQTSMRRLREATRKLPGGYSAEAQAEREPGLGQKILEFAPVRYPLKAFGTLFRPLSAPTPAAVHSLQGERPFGEEVAERAGTLEGETGLGKAVRAGGQVLQERLGRALTAAQAAADPLGRFSATGARGKIGTYEPASWQDVVERWFQGQQKPVTREDLEGMVARGDAPTVEDAAAKVWLEQKAKIPGTEVEIGRPVSQAGAFAASLAFDPAVWASAPRAAAGGGLRVGGMTVVPESARAMPGALLGKIPGPVGRAGAKVSLEGLGKAMTWPARKAAEFEVWGGQPLGLALKKLVWRYADLDRIADPYLRDQAKQAFRLRDAAVSQQSAEWRTAVERLLAGVSPENRRLIRDIVESPPEAFEWGARGPGSFRGPEPELPVGPFGAPGAMPRPPAVPGPLGRMTARFRRPAAEKEVRGRATTQMGPIPGEGAVPPGSEIPPGAPRQGPIPTAPVHEVTPAEAELAARIADMDRTAWRAVAERGFFKGSPETGIVPYDLDRAAEAALRREQQLAGLPEHFPRERTAESLRLERGARAPASERLGMVRPEAGPMTDFGFLKSRTEADYVNRLVDELNRRRAQGAAEAPGTRGAARTLPGRVGYAPERPLEPVPDTTTALNEFYRRPPKELRRELGGPIRAEAERFLDDAEETLSRYFGRVTRGVNDYDLMGRLREMKDSSGRVVARPVVRVDPDGVPVERLPFGPMGGAPEAGVPAGVRRIPGYRVPRNKAWNQAFPDVALPDEIARAVDEVGVPYWHRNLLDQLFVRPLHKVQGGWKTSATVARLGFGLRNYFSQFGMNVAAYGPAAANPVRIAQSHVLAMPDSAMTPGLLAREIEVGGRRLTVGELRGIAQQAGLTRTLPREVIYGGPEFQALEGAPHGVRSWQGWLARHPSVPWGAAGAGAGAALGGPVGGAAGAAIGAVLGSRRGRPFNPMSREFLLTKHVFAPVAEFSERQGRFLAFLLELEERAKTAKDLRSAADDAARLALGRRGQVPETGARGGAVGTGEAAAQAEARARDPIGAAMRASEQQVDYSAFSPFFEKYVTLGWPFAKWTAGMMKNLPEWALRRPGLAQVSEQAFRSGEHLVPPWERQMVEREPESKLERETAARVVGFPGVGPLREPRTRKAKGGLRLPFATASPFADVTLNVFGGPARVLAAQDRGKQLASEVLESALPAWKIPYELLAGRNLYTQEPVNLQQAVPAPRAVQVLNERNPELARKMFKAAPVYDEERKISYLGVPQWVSLFVRYFPNITTYDLVASYFGGKRPYDNQDAITLRLFGLTQLLHDPELQASQEARAARDAAQRVKQTIESWNPPRRQEPEKESRP